MSHSSEWANAYKDDIHHQSDTVIRYAGEDSAIVELTKRIRRLSDKLINVLTDNPSLSTQAVNEWNVSTWREWYEELARVTQELKAATAADETLLENSVWFLCRTLDDLLFWMEYPDRNESPDATVEVEAVGVKAVDPPKKVSLDEQALALFVVHHDWSKKQIADALRCNEKSLAPKRCPRLNSAIQAYRGNDLPSGSKSKDGSLEAWD